MNIERLLNGISVAHRNEEAPQELAEYAERVSCLDPINPKKLTELITHCTERLKTRPTGILAVLWPSLIMKVNNGTEHQTRITRENWKKGVECLLFYWPEFSARNAYLETVAVPFDPETKKPFEPVYVMRGVDFWPPRVFNEGSKMRDMTWDHDV